MKLILNNDNLLQFDPASRQRITLLKLNGKVIIRADPSNTSTGQGNYLMFPWVNRITINPYPDIPHEFVDKNGLLLHGFMVNRPRQQELKQLQNQPLEQQIIFRDKNPHKNMHSFQQNFNLKQKCLKVSCEVIENLDDNLPYCFGYHPFLQIQDENLSDLFIKTDICSNLRLGENLLPRFPLEREKMEIVSDQKYDHLFEGGTYFELISKDGTHVRIQSNLPFWQIYTPPCGKRIAVEPMSFIGDLYHIYPQMPAWKLPKQGSFTISCWQSK